ncbi:uncharacterized protein [Littorina saxatilis]|uniref:Uncharacterized protein n=1 Tax=Littorina saxatilis TaxID=31220 RepID=A0AAN9AW26_9CAEN
MFKSVLLLSLAALALGQRNNWWQNALGTSANVDTVHGFTVQYDDEHDIVIFVNRDGCYIVEAQSDRQWDAIIRNMDDLHAFTEAVYNQIQAKTGLSHMSHSAASSAYHSRLETWECARKDVTKVAYMPASN